jgi:hypothetical protein
VIYPPPGRSLHDEDTAQVGPAPQATRVVSTWLVVFAFLSALTLNLAGMDWEWLQLRITGEVSDSTTNDLGPDLPGATQDPFADSVFPEESAETEPDAPIGYPFRSSPEVPPDIPTFASPTMLPFEPATPADVATPIMLTPEATETIQVQGQPTLPGYPSNRDTRSQDVDDGYP